jgi:AraC-like DNA-binding protein
MPNDGQMMRRARLRSSVVAACRDEQLSATTEPTQDNIVFDRWVIDTQSIGAVSQMQTVMAETMVPYFVEPKPTEHLGRPPCVVRRAQFDGLTLLDCEVPDIFSGRTQGTDGGATDVMLYTLMMSGRQVVTQGRRHAVLDPGDLFIVDSALPGTCHIPNDIRTFTLVVPKDLVSIRGSLPERLPAASPTARLLGDYIRLLVRDVASLPAAAVTIIACATMELVQLATTTDDLSPDSVPLRIALLPQVRRFIERQLADPDLSPEMIADTNAISLRTLHAMFAETGESVSTYIRRRRLHRSHDALIGRRDRPIIDIAQDWGFKNPSHFARTFKAEYGLAPQEFRRTVIAERMSQAHSAPA